MNKGRSRSFIVQAIPFAVILSLAAELRLLFHTGMVHIDSLAYAHLARNVADGIWRLTYPGLERWAMARIGLYGPVAALYALFGPNSVTTFAWPFACSLFGVACAYGIGRRLAGESAGLLSAFLWAVLPTNVAAGTALLGDGPIAALSIATVWFMLVAESAHGPRRMAAAFASVLCLVVGITNKPAMLLLFVFLAVYLIARRPMKPLVWLGVGAGVALGVAAYGYYTWDILRLEWTRVDVASTMQMISTAATDWWSNIVLGSPEFSWIAPLWVVAGAALLTQRHRPGYVPLLWFWSMFLYLELGTRSLFAYVPITTASLGPASTRHFLLVAAPAMIASGVYLAQPLRPAAARWLIGAAAALTAAIAWVGLRHATNLDWGITGETALPFATVSALAIGITIFGTIASPLATAGTPAHAPAAPRPINSWKPLAIAVLSLAIGVASLNLSYRATASYHALWLTTFPEAVQFLEKDPAVPILVQHDVFGQRLDYLSNFRLGFNSVLRDAGPRARIHVAPPDPSTIRDAYILIDEYYLRVSRAAGWPDGPDYFRHPPANWAEVARFGGYEGARLRIYRAFGLDQVEQLAAARSAVRASRNQQTLRQLLAAATGAGEYCEAVAAWDALRRTDPASVKGLDLLPQIRACSTSRPDLRGPNLFQNGDFTKGLEAWIVHPDSDAIVSVDRDGPTDRAWHVKYRKGDWRVISQGRGVKPDTIYVYEADIKTTAPVLSLYWESDIGRFLDFVSTYPDWTHLHYVFITPPWDGQPFPAFFNPVLMKGPGEAWLKNLRLSEFRVPPVQ